MSNEEIVTPRRLEGLIDGIFAFSMTLLVIFINVPEFHHLNSPLQLHNYLVEQWPQFVSYLVTFLLLANFWIIHHLISNRIGKTNYIHIWLNIFFVLFIVLLPFVSVILGDYPETWGSIFLLTINLIFINSFLLAIWLYSSHHKYLLKPDVDQKCIKFTTNQLLIGLFICLLGFIVSIVYLPIALYVYLLMPIFFTLYDIY